MTMLEIVKQALRVTGGAYDGRLTLLISVAVADLALAGADSSEYATDPLVQEAVCTFCAARFGTVEPEEYDRLKKSYAEQKAQMQMSGKYSLYDKKVQPDGT